MKELSIEEKAKRYDEALKRARKIENGEPINVPDGTSIPTAIFPELYESEGERIRKQIISFLKEFEYDHYRNLDFSSWIAWLEKQGEKKESLCDKCRKQQPSHSCQDITALGRCALEKQGEQKPVNDTDEDIVEVIKNTSILDMVEPKFKAGDWIIDKQGLVHQIENVVENVTNHTFGYDIVGGGYFNDNSDVHLWTIQDAKDGDVLHSPSHRLIWIYKNLGQYYACANMNYTTECVNTNGLISIPKDVCPATKDERTILFEMMKEAGYEWNEDKKELIKL